MKHPETKLERHVWRWLREYKNQGYDNLESLAGDLLQHGCVSGMVGHLCYYVDTIRFYKRHKIEINALLVEYMGALGESSSAGVFGGDKWDTDDPLALDTQNQNLLAWFGFEETARVLYENED